MKIVVIDPHAIYRRGLVASLELGGGGHAVRHGGAAGATTAGTFADADIVIVDGSMDGAVDLVRAATAAGARVLVCATDDSIEPARAALAAGAIGYLRKETLTPELLQAALKAVQAGVAMIAPAALAAALRSAPPPGDVAPRGEVLSGREQRVLTLIARGHPTREVAVELCYSERTVKNVLHDIVTKLNARSRSQAIAHAVRTGLI